MTCRQAENLLSAYCDHELTGEEMLRLRQHLSTCPDCAQEMQTIQKLQALMDSASEPEIPAGLESRLRAAISAEANKKSAASRQVSWAAAAAVAAVAVWFALGFMPRDSEIAAKKSSPLSFEAAQERRSLMADDPLVGPAPAILVDNER